MSEHVVCRNFAEKCWSWLHSRLNKLECFTWFLNAYGTKHRNPVINSCLSISSLPKWSANISIFTIKWKLSIFRKVYGLSKGFWTYCTGKTAIVNVLKNAATLKTSASILLGIQKSWYVAISMWKWSSFFMVQKCDYRNVYLNGLML